jgi:zinc protease
MKRLALLASLLLAASISSTIAEVRPWPQAVSDLKADPKATFGSLDNGLRYVILPNQEPPGRASLRLYMDVGSLMEDDDQQGLAHFLEHMAFNGSKNFAAGSLVEYFQRLGMGFGADTNAHTSFKETVYQLELPKVEEKLVADAMKLFRDDLDGMLLGAQEIDKERGVIQSEKLARDSVDYRTMLEGFKFALPDGKISSRMPIGIDATLKTMQQQRFADFYESYYTPGRAIVVVVGDVDVAMVKKIILSAFADAKPKRGEKPDPDFGKVSENRGTIAKLHTELESASTDISIEAMHSASKLPDSAAQRRKQMVRNFGDTMINQRFSKLVKAEGAPFLGAEGYSYEYLQFVEVNGVMAKCKPEQWQAALAVIEQELRRALEHGFNDAEFEEAKAEILKGAKLRAEQASTRKSRDLATQLSSVLASGKVFTDPVADQARVEAAVATLTKDECLTALRESWATKDIQIFVGGNLKLEGDAAKTIITAFKDSAAKPVAAPAIEQTAAFAYTDFGPAGKIASRSEVKDLEITQLVFENNVRVNLKKTPFQKNAVSVSIGFGGGKMEVPADKPGIAAFTGSIFEEGALVKHSSDELRRLFASKSVSADFAIGDDTFLLAGKTTPQDIDAELQLLTAYLTAPGYREEAARTFMKGLEPMYTEMEHTAEGVMNDKVVAFIHSGDHRFGVAPRGEMEKRTLSEAKAWLAKPLAESYMEVAVVGDFDMEATITALSKTLGALPKRADKKTDFSAARAVKFPTEPKSKDFHFATEIARAYALIYWPTTDMYDIQKTRRLSLLGQILDDRLRLKVREELGESYSPTCYHLPSDAYTGYGYMSAIITLKPDHVAKVGPIVAALGDTLANGKISDDEFERARKPQLTQIEQMRRDNGYWSQRVLRNCQEQPQRLDWSRSLVDDFANIKKEDLEALAKEYLKGDRALAIGIIPDAPK